MRPFSYKSPEWQAARLGALQRARWRCAMCKRSVAGKGQARVDHIATVKEHPARALDPTNLRVLCTECDARRHAEKGRRKTERVEVGLDGYPKNSV